MVSAGQLRIGAIHTYLELFARYFVDLTPRVSLVCAQSADAQGNLYTGPNTEDTPAIVEATAFRRGIVIAQVNELVDAVPRVDIPGDWVDYVVLAPKPNFIEPLFTRDPAQISEIQVLMAMMAIKGLYAEYGVQRLNHGIGFNTAAIELILPTYGESLGLKGKICRNWTLNPHPTLIPAIESGWVESVHCFGTELGMEGYIAQRPGTVDRRQRRLELTELGASLERKLSENQRRRIAAAYRAAGPNAVEGFRRVMLGLIDERDRGKVAGEPAKPQPGTPGRR